MLYPEYKYVGYKSDLKERTAIVPWPFATEQDEREHYRSIYRFNDSVLAHNHLADLGPSVSFYSDYLVFDFDSHESVTHAHKDAIEMATALKKMGAGYECYFSGNKGFHVLVPTCQFGFVPTTDEGILRRMAETLGNRFKTFDSSIYNKTRIFRCTNSVNKKSGLFKIAISEEWLEQLDLDMILDLAKRRNDYNFPAPTEYVKVQPLIALYEKCKNKVNRAILPSEPKQSYTDFGIIKEAVAPGYRNRTLYGMARDFAKRGIYERDCLVICRWWNASLPHPLDNAEVDRTIQSAYTKGVNELVSADNIFNFAFNSKRALAHVRTSYQNWEENVVKTGYHFLDEYTLGLFKGEVVFIISRQGNFKTCVLSNILHGIAKSTNRPTLLFSMEMGVDALTPRLIQKSENMTQAEVLDGIRNGLDFPNFEKEFSNLHIINLSALNTDRVLQIIDQFLEQYGSLGAIGFDYLSLFEGCANDTARTARMATELKTRIAKAADCPTFCLVQAKREYQGKEGDLEIDVSAGKDSSSIEDSGDYVIGMWGHWEYDYIRNDGGEPIKTSVKPIYGRFLKARKFDSIKYPNGLPYFRLDLDKARMDLKAIHYVASPPRFKQKESASE